MVLCHKGAAKGDGAAEDVASVEWDGSLSAEAGASECRDAMGKTRASTPSRKKGGLSDGVGRDVAE